MRILLIGGGGREHALAWKLSQEAEVICAPGNPGISEDVECVSIPTTDHSRLVQLATDRSADLVVVGPEDPLIDGLGDRMRAEGFLVYGPNQDGAALEGSKVFSKDLMQAAGVPTAKFQTFTNPDLASAFAKARFDQGRQVAVKASGNALGKGVVVASTFEEASEAIHRMMVAKEFGVAGESVVVEDRLFGPEFSVLTVVGDQNFVTLPIAQDHKRAYDGDRGPNTGGMGTYSPVTWVTDSMIEIVNEQVVAPTLRELKRRGIQYRGTLFSGLMMDSGNPYCLEFNVRFGDPETQSVMMRLGTGFAECLLSAASGGRIERPTVLDNAAVSVVVASEGYPVSSRKGDPISFGLLPVDAKIFHAGTALKDGNLVTNGGRVVAATASGPDYATARSRAYIAARAVQFSGGFFRSDIGPA